MQVLNTVGPAEARFILSIQSMMIPMCLLRRFYASLFPPTLFYVVSASLSQPGINNNLYHMIKMMFPLCTYCPL